MSTNTPNYNLVKPDGAEGGDFVDISVINANMDTLDTQLKAVSDNAPATAPYSRRAVSAAFNVGNNVTPNVILPFNTNIVTNQISYDSGTGSWTMTKAGLYLVQITVLWNAGTANTRRYIELLKEGTTVSKQSSNTSDVVAIFSQTLTDCLQLAVGDTLQVRAYQNSGGGLTVAEQEENSHATIAWLRP